METKKIKVIISGGGTGGHIFPAISIANALKSIEPETEILFVGAKGRMEMEKVPNAGYSIIGLPVSGFKRKLSLKNIWVLIRLAISLVKAKKIIRQFKPDVVVGVGGYASGPILKMASKAGIPTLLQEQNSYAGVTNRLLAQKASKICVAYHHMSRFFPSDKIIVTGNPVRQDLEHIEGKRDDAYEFFDLKPGIKTILVIGGSLGAQTLNQSIMDNLGKIRFTDVQILWQTGSRYYKELKTELDKRDIPNIKIFDFISRMDLAYAVSDMVISRAGACTISELTLVGKPAILIPSPNVAEDHQTKNATALFEKDAIRMCTDAGAPTRLIDIALMLIANDAVLAKLSENIAKLALPNSAKRIAEQVLELAKNKQ